MQNDGKKLVRAIGKVKGGIGEITAVYADGTVEYFTGDIRTGKGVLFVKRYGITEKRLELESYEGRRLAS